MNADERVHQNVETTIDQQRHAQVLVDANAKTLQRPGVRGKAKKETGSID